MNRETTDKIIVLLEIRKVDNKDTQGAFRKPTSIIRNRCALEECSDSVFVVLSRPIVQWFLFCHLLISVSISKQIRGRNVASRSGISSPNELF